MHFISHFLSGLCISLGFILFYSLPFKKKTALLLVFLLGGLSIGMYQHLMIQDAIYYSTEGFMNNCVYMHVRGTTPALYALCLVVFNNGEKCKMFEGDGNG